MLEEKFNDISALILRIVFGGLMLVNHGWGKMMKFFGDEPIKFADPIGLGETTSLGLAVFAEALCAFLIVIGLRTRLAVVPLVITMLVAIFVIHISDPFKKMELGIIYLFAYVVIALLNSGRYSVDALISKNK
ncbi:MAG: DoxX family protein [Calditrichaeota bacterium]|nr:MAG: DoxX family protein [Calditrichota bacterium]